MRVLRPMLVAVAAFVAWRVFAGRARQALQRLLGAASHPPHVSSVVTTEPSSQHTSAAAAANHDFWDDRDIPVADKLSAVGMQPGDH